jgi:anti-anti-sigma regulatory factor
MTIDGSPMKRAYVLNPAPQINLYTSSPSGLRAQAVAAADEALNVGHNLLVLGLDCLTEFNDGAVLATIVALRKLRDVGGSVRLVTENDDHRNRLEVTGLNRIFDVVPLIEAVTEHQRDPKADAKRFRHHA